MERNTRGEKTPMMKRSNVGTSWNTSDSKKHGWRRNKSDAKKQRHSLEPEVLSTTSFTPSNKNAFKQRHSFKQSLQSSRLGFGERRPGNSLPTRRWPTPRRASELEVRIASRWWPWGEGLLLNQFGSHAFICLHLLRRWCSKC
jgi:hypothetical protein